MLAATLLYDCSDTPGGGASSRPVAAARPARVHGRHASLHGCGDTVAGMPRLAALARHTTPGGDCTPCPAAQASHGGGATNTKRADRSDYDPTRIYFLYRISG